MAVYPERRGDRISGAWIAEVTQRGERRRKRFKTKREAQRWADYTKVTGEEPSGPTATTEVKHTFDAVLKEAKRNHDGWAGDRDPSRWQRLELVEEVFGADAPVESIRRADFDRLVDKLKKRKAPGGGRLSPGTINRYLALASAVLAYAQEHDYIVGAPKVPWQQEAGRRIHWLTSEAENAVHASIRAEGRLDEALTLRVLTATGMRWGEFATLTLEQIEGEWVKLNKTKTDTPRDVPIDPELGAALRDMIARGAVPQYHTFRKTLKRALKSAGKSEALSIHCLRHTTATRLVQAGVNLAVAKDFLGHRSLNTTLRYTHLVKEQLVEARKKLSPHAGQSAQEVEKAMREIAAPQAKVEPATALENAQRLV